MLIAAICAAAQSGCAAPVWDQGTDGAPSAVYLTWQGDPTTTMTIHWLSGADETADEVSYATADGFMLTAAGDHRPVPHSPYLVHTVELTGLDPGRDYRFIITGREEGEFRFRTMPATAASPITFIEGGDFYETVEIDDRIYRQAASRDPMFVVLAGDLVYDDGASHRVGRWFRWLEFWSSEMVDSAGRLIPLLVAIGNHEVRGWFDQTPAQAPLFYTLFASPGLRGYDVVDFGDYMSIVRLDSGHTHPIAGEQTGWLHRTLAERRDVPHLMAVYHVPSHPSVRSFNDGKSPVIREHWVPLFDQYGVDVVYEAHDHAYKRTHPIRNGAVDPSGVLYLGDGGWGVGLRDVHPADRTWYLAKSLKVHSFIVTTIQGNRIEHYAVNELGEVIDRYPEE